jgi:hypothetical protein
MYRFESMQGRKIYSYTRFNLNTRTKWVVSFMLRPLYFRWMSHRYPLKRRFGGPQGHSGRFEDEKNLSARNLTLHLPALSVDTVPTEPSQFPELCLMVNSKSSA